MGERYTGSVEVMGSNPTVSTHKNTAERRLCGVFRHAGQVPLEGSGNLTKKCENSMQFDDCFPAQGHVRERGSQETGGNFGKSYHRVQRDYFVYYYSEYKSVKKYDPGSGAPCMAGALWKALFQFFPTIYSEKRAASGQFLQAAEDQAGRLQD